MAIEFLKEVAHRFSQQDSLATHTLYGDKGEKTVTLEPRVNGLLNRATNAQELGRTDEARSLYIDTATGARAVYETISPQGITADERLVRAQHAEVAVVSFIEAGEFSDARSFSETVLADALIPEISKSRIRTLIEMLEKTS